MSNELQVPGFSVLQEAIQQARYNALKVANAEPVNLYWQVGAFVSKQLAQSQWGDKTVQQFADFLKKEEPGKSRHRRFALQRQKQRSRGIRVKPQPFADDGGRIQNAITR